MVVEGAIVAAAARRPVAVIMRAAAVAKPVPAAVDRFAATQRPPIQVARVQVQVTHQRLRAVVADMPTAVVADMPAAAADMPAVVVADMPAVAVADMPAVAVDIGKL
jgi:hypothetical protein